MILLSLSDSYGKFTAQIAASDLACSIAKKAAAKNVALSII
jgi:hypothetical protein